MIKSVEMSGKTEEQAIESALCELGLQRDDVSVEILERAKSGFLGIGATQARVRVSYEAKDEPKAKAVASPTVAPKSEPKAAAAPAAKPQAKRVERAPTLKSEFTPSGDEHADKAAEFVAGLLFKMDMNATIEIGSKDNGDVLINLSGDSMGAVIGRRGETLDAIQHLTNYSVNRGGEKRRHISIDAESYRAKREESLIHLAEKMATKAIKYKRSMALEPMNSYERHVIHTALQDFEGVTTGSVGTEPNRRVVVSWDKNSGVMSAEKSSSTREWS